VEYTHNNFIRAKAGIQVTLHDEIISEMGKSLQDMMEDKMDGAGQSRVESTARSALGRLVTGFPPFAE